MNDFSPVPTGAVVLPTMKYQSKSLTATLSRRTLVPQVHVLVNANTCHHTMSNAKQFVRIARWQATQTSNK